MKKLNNNGFTLVELMAVIVILAIIIGIAVPASLSISHKIRVNMCNKKIEMLEGSARLYGEDNQSTGEVSVKKLVDEGYVKKDSKDNGGIVQNPLNSESMNNCTISIGSSNNRVTAKFNKQDGVCSCN